MLVGTAVISSNALRPWLRGYAHRIRFVQPPRCAFENIESGTQSVDFRHATQIHESHDLCRMGVRTVRRGALRTPHLLGVGPSGRVRRHPAVGSNAVLERARPDHIAKHSRCGAMTTGRATATPNGSAFLRERDVVRIMARLV